ncbi:TPA: hypothetical protein MB812_005656 [Klebsiella pneumoniae]|nr:hypothetical protein [Klebsiella pneumoniae]HBQ3185600.1 hypothetical protein [Klebsiella variicola subsp. variicola]HBS3584664.1 hypothetical protein [Klebsiella pneumoniae]HBS7893130.1 hypothetical protein [Klebsiella pneumoniae]HBS8318980.1 hypothetical protein [Klebsiella pneumoniae]
MMRDIDLNQFAETVTTIAWLINPGSPAGRCKRGCAICPVQAHKTLNLTNTKLKYVCCVALKQSPVKYSLNDTKPVKFFVCHSHQHKIAVLC